MCNRTDKGQGNRQLHLLGLTVKRETEILALAAFLLALASSVYAVYSYLIGEEIRIVAVDEVTIFENICSQDKSLQFAVPFVYVNKASKDYSGVVLRSGLRLEIVEGVEYTFLGAFIVERTSNKISDVATVDCEKLPDDEWTALRRLTIRTIGSPKPLIVGGSSAASQELLLSVVDKSCDYGIDCDKQEFPPRFESFRKRYEGLDVIKLTLFGNVDGEREVSFVCTVKLSPEAKHQLKTGRWLNLPCDKV